MFCLLFLFLKTYTKKVQEIFQVFRKNTQKKRFFFFGLVYFLVCEGEGGCDAHFVAIF